MKTLALVVVAAAIVLVWYLRDPARSPAASSPAPRAAAAAGAATAGPTGSSPVPRHVTRLSSEERREVADRIASAHTARAATSAPARPSLPERPHLDPEDTEGFKTTLRGAMQEVIPLLADCYDQAGSSVPRELTVRAHLELIGDPDIGTLIDAGETTDEQQQVLPAAFDDCLRSTLQSLELPPLAEGDHVKVTYPFLFRAAE